MEVCIYYNVPNIASTAGKGKLKMSKNDIEIKLYNSSQIKKLKKYCPLQTARWDSLDLHLIIMCIFMLYVYVMTIHVCDCSLNS